MRGEDAPIIRVGQEDWAAVTSLASSLPSSKHYTFDAATREISFGNGFNGSAPGKGDRISVKPFRYTQGAKGNLNASMNWRLASPPDALSWQGANPFPVTDGKDPESPEDTELRARENFRANSRGITAEDLEALAKQTPGIRVSRAKVLPGYIPSSCAGPEASDIAIVVLPSSRPDSEPRVPTAGFLATVNRYLQTRRLVASRLRVLAPDFVPVNLSVSVTLKKNVSETQARREVDASVRSFLSPVQWPFGRDIFPSEIHQRLAALDGVAFASKLRINGMAAPLLLGPTQLPRLESITLEIPRVRHD